MDLAALCEAALSDLLHVLLSRHKGLTGQALAEPACPPQRETKAWRGGWGGGHRTGSSPRLNQHRSFLTALPLSVLPPSKPTPSPHSI